jgi:transposase
VLELSTRLNKVFLGVEFMAACLSHSPDAYLDELQAKLVDACGVKVHISTVWRALRRRGFALKKVLA